MAVDGVRFTPWAPNVPVVVAVLGWLAAAARITMATGVSGTPDCGIEYGLWPLPAKVRTRCCTRTYFILCGDPPK